MGSFWKNTGNNKKKQEIEKSWKPTKTTPLTANTTIFALNKIPSSKQPFPKQEKTSNTRQKWETQKNSPSNQKSIKKTLNKKIIH